MYYLQDKTQSEIAQTLGLSRVKIYRLLKEAREAGVVEITIHRFRARNDRLECELRERFGLGLLNLAAAADGPETAADEAKKGKDKKAGRAALPAAEAEPGLSRPAPVREIKRGSAKPLKLDPPKPEPALFPELAAGYNFPLLTLLDAGSLSSIMYVNVSVPKKFAVGVYTTFTPRSSTMRQYRPGSG